MQKIQLKVKKLLPEAKLPAYGSEFAAGADLLIWDATFAPEHLRPGWGHSTWAQGLEVVNLGETP